MMPEWLREIDEKLKLVRGDEETTATEQDAVIFAVDQLYFRDIPYLLALVRQMGEALEHAERRRGWCPICAEFVMGEELVINHADWCKLSQALHAYRHGPEVDE